MYVSSSFHRLAEQLRSHSTIQPIRRMKRRRRQKQGQGRRAFHFQIQQLVQMAQVLAEIQMGLLEVGVVQIQMQTVLGVAMLCRMVVQVLTWNLLPMVPSLKQRRSSWQRWSQSRSWER